MPSCHNLYKYKVQDLSKEETKYFTEMKYAVDHYNGILNKTNFFHIIADKAPKKLIGKFKIERCRIPVDQLGKKRMSYKVGVVEDALNN